MARKRTTQSTEDTPVEEDTAPQAVDTPDPAHLGGMALYGLARDLTGQKLTDAWNALPAGLHAPYVKRAQAVIDAIN